MILDIMHEFLLVLLQSCQINFRQRMFAVSDKPVGPEWIGSAGIQTAVSVLMSKTPHMQGR